MKNIVSKIILLFLLAMLSSCSRGPDDSTLLSALNDWTEKTGDTRWLSIRSVKSEIIKNESNLYTLNCRVVIKALQTGTFSPSWNRLEIYGKAIKDEEREFEYSVEIEKKDGNWIIRTVSSKTSPVYW